eukprot:jgi/Phyca11/15005/fgenesh1_pg.PHYCAscaffold_10_\
MEFNAEELDAVLSLVDRGQQQSGVDGGYLSALGDGDYDPENQTSAQQKKKKLNYDPNKARNERRFELINVGNVVVESFGLEFTDVVAGTTATFYVQQILRRYIEDERTVIVWNAYVEPFMFENERVTGVYFLEQSHVIIKPEHRDTAEDAVSTRMSSCEIVTPHFLDPRLKDDPKMAALTDFVTSSLSSNIMTRNEKVEDMLLDESLRRGDSNSS